MRYQIIVVLSFFVLSFPSFGHEKYVSLIEPWHGSIGPTAIYKHAIRAKQNFHFADVTNVHVSEETSFCDLSITSFLNGAHDVGVMTIQNLHYRTIIFRQDDEMAPGTMRITHVSPELMAVGKIAKRVMQGQSEDDFVCCEYILDGGNFGIEGYKPGQAPGEYSADDVMRDLQHMRKANLEIRGNKKNMRLIQKNCTELTTMVMNKNKLDILQFSRSGDEIKVLF